MVEYKWPVVKDVNTLNTLYELQGNATTITTTTTATSIASKPVYAMTNFGTSIDTSKKNKDDILDTGKKTSYALGIATFIAYALCFTSVYISAIINCRRQTLMKILKNQNINVNYISDYSLLFKSGFDNNPLKVNTISFSLDNSSKKISILGLMIFLLFLQLLFLTKNITFNTDNIMGTLVFVFNFLIITFWLLCLFVPPADRRGNASLAHFGIAFLILTLILVNSVLISYMYYEYFTFDTIKDLLVSCLLVIIGMVLFFGSLLVYGIIHRFFRAYESRYISIFIGFSEMLSLIFFGVFIIMLSRCPPLPSGPKICFINQTGQT